jgi:ATP-dependent DNA helicase RecG
MNDKKAVENLLEAKEGEHCQFKEANNQHGFDEAAQICCALANCGGGKFVLGISDKRPRQIVGTAAFSQPERTRLDLIDRLRINVDFDLLEVDGKRVLVFTVDKRPTGMVVEYKERAYWYCADKLCAMPDDVRRTIYAEISHDFSADPCPEATPDDLDSAAIEAFRVMWAKKSGNKRYLSQTITELLTNAGAITRKGEITYAALVLFGTPEALRALLPNAEIRFEYRLTEASGPAAHSEDFREGFFSCYNRIWELINLRNDWQHYQQGLFVFDIPTFNERVVREALLNAVAHRSYELPASTFIRQYPDKLIFESPGGFPYGVTVENVLTMSTPRNRLIAEILQFSGLVERSGQGMNMIYEWCIREAKPEPDFAGTNAYRVRLTLDGIVVDKEMLKVIKSIGEEQLEMLTTNHFQIITMLYRERQIPKNMREQVKKLVEMGIAEHMGRGRYILARRFYEAVGRSGTHTRVAGLKKEVDKEFLLEHLRQAGAKGSRFGDLGEAVPHLSSNQIKVLLRELRTENRIYFEGKTSAGRWYIADS